MAAFFLKLLLNFCSILSLRGAQGLGSGLGWIANFIPNSIRHVTQRNIELCFPELDKEQQLKLRKRCLQESAKSFTELGLIWNRPVEQIKHLVIRAEQEELMQQGVDSGRGVLCLIPHLGNWEICNLYFSQPFQPTSLYRPPRIESLNQYILQARTHLGSNLVPTTTSGIKAVFKALRSGGVVGILPDQDPGRGQGLYVPFFNIACNTMPLISRIVQKVNPVVLLIHVIRLPKGGGFEMFLETMPEGIYDADPAVATAAMNQAIERVVRQAPEQYQWTYKRFKHQPDDRDLYR